MNPALVMKSGKLDEQEAVKKERAMDCNLVPKHSTAKNSYESSSENDIHKGIKSPGHQFY